MPAMANIINAVNQARRKAGLTVYDTAGIRRTLTESSDQTHEVGPKYYGQLIDLPRAIELATAPTSTAFLPAIYSLLGTSDDG